MRYAIDRNGNRWDLQCGKLVQHGVGCRVDNVELCYGPLTWNDDEPEHDKPSDTFIKDRYGSVWKMECDGCFQRLGNTRGFALSREQLDENLGPLVEVEPDQSNYAGGTQADWDAVSRPRHYHKGGLECITVCDAMVEGLRPVEAFRLANIVKYLWRYKQKNGKQDLEKARKYLDMLIEVQS